MTNTPIIGHCGGRVHIFRKNDRLTFSATLLILNQQVNLLSKKRLFFGTRIVMSTGETNNKQRDITNKGDLAMWLIRRNNDLADYPRLLNRYLNYLWNDLPAGHFGLEEDSVVWHPRLDLSESENEYKVLADLPGLSKEEIKISLRENVLTISGERKYEKKEDSKDYASTERAYGKFERSVSLPDKIKESDIKANYKNGVLTISLPKSEEAKPREISIS